MNAQLIAAEETNWLSGSNRGYKFFEYSNHLGNVLTVTSDKKLYDPVSESYSAQIISTSDYYPFGLSMYGEQYNSGRYRFGFNGQEQDRETGTINYKYREYDPRIVRFPSVDPIASQYPELTSYQHSSLNPIWMIELEGLEGVKYDIQMATRDAPKLNMTRAEYRLRTSPGGIGHEGKPYEPNRDEMGNVIINGTAESIKHYYQGGGENVVLGDDVIRDMINSERVQGAIRNIESGRTTRPASPTGPLAVDMTYNGQFFVGRIAFTYSTTCEGGTCVTSYTLDDEGFVDPNVFSAFFWGDNAGPNAELGGDTYDFAPVTWERTFENPGYEVDNNGNPLPIER